MKNNGKNIKKGNVRKKKKNRKKNKYKGIDLYIFCSVLVLVAIGIIMVFSASYYDALYKHKDVFYFLKKELTWAPVGLVALVVMMLIDYHVWKKFTVAAYGVTVIALVAVLFFGSTINGATRWLKIAGVSFQPSELAKYVIVFFLAMIIDKYGKVSKNWKIPLIYLFSAALFAGLVFLENNLSIASIIMFVAFIMVFVSGMSFKETFSLICIGGVIGSIGIFTSDYRTERFISFLDPWKYSSDEGYQLVHSLYALGSGGLFGVGLGNSKQKALYMPEPHNDFIFAIIGEELGLIGCILVILLFILLVYRCVRIALKCEDIFGCMLVIGIGSLIGIQAALNIAVATSTMPNTGVALPFISYGGTSLTMLMGEIGIVLNISKSVKIN